MKGEGDQADVHVRIPAGPGGPLSLLLPPKAALKVPSVAAINQSTGTFRCGTDPKERWMWAWTWRHNLRRCPIWQKAAES